MDIIMPEIIKFWRKKTKLAGPADRLQTREFAAMSLAVKEMHEGKSGDLLGAPLLYYWPIHFQEALSILGEIPTPFSRVLDVGSGLCSASFAASKYGADEITAVGENEEALRIGSELCGKLGGGIRTKRWKVGKGKCPVEGPFDLIIVSHSLFKMFPQGGADEWILEMMKLLDTDGNLVIIDSSFGTEVLKLRDNLVEKGVAVQAPCVYKGKCPALEKGFPCFAQRELDKPPLMKDFQRVAGINLSSLKMSYLIVRKEWPKLPAHDLFRVVSPPFENHLGKQFHLCGTPGRKSLSCRLETVPEAARPFDYLKRGELIEVEGAFKGETNLQIIEGTEVKVVAACGKPLPLVW